MKQNLSNSKKFILQHINNKKKYYSPIFNQLRINNVNSKSFVNKLGNKNTHNNNSNSNSNNTSNNNIKTTIDNTIMSFTLKCGLLANQIEELRKEFISQLLNLSDSILNHNIYLNFPIISNIDKKKNKVFPNKITNKNLNLNNIDGLELLYNEKNNNYNNNNNFK